MNKPPPGVPKPMLSNDKLKRYLLCTVILLIAFALRIVAINHIPPGLSHDEAYNGVTAIEVLKGQRRIFFEINKGIEPLIIYLEAVAFYLFGISPVSLRLVNIFCGLLTVALIYPLTIRLLNRRIALLAMIGLAISFWAIFVSRLTLRAVTLPPLLLLTLYFFWRALQPSKQQPSLTANLIFWGLSGLAAGATMYTYLSSRFMSFIVGAIFGYQWLRGQTQRRHWLGLILHFAIWALIFTPLAQYFWVNADSFTRRSDQVSTIPYLLNGEIGPTLESTGLTLGMFTFHGDETDRYNLDGRPIFDWLNGLIFYFGIVLVLLHLQASPQKAGPAVFLLIWAFFMLLPDFITDDSPHFLRTIGALPVVYILWAVGLERLGSSFGQFINQSSASRQWSSQFQRALPITLLILLLSTIVLHMVYDYFARWAVAAEARAIYGADIAEIADHLKQAAAKDFPAISAEYYRDLDPFRLTLHFHGQPPFAIWFDGRQSLAFPPPESGLNPDYFFAASAPIAEAWRPFLQRVPQNEGQSYTLYHLTDQVTLAQAWAATFPAENSLNVNVHDDLRLLDYRLLGSVVSGGSFEVLLGWQALRTLPPDADYTFLVRLRDNQGHIWAEADGNGYAPGDWQPGVRALQRLTVRLPGDLPSRAFDLTLEVVDRRQGQALPTTGGDSLLILETMTAQ